MDTTKEKIIETTLDIIGNEGITGITIRRIAKESGVNVAALNYHFGSKENLLNEAFGYFKSQVLKIFDSLLDQNIPPEDRLRAFVADYINHLNRSPGIPRALISMTISGKDLNPEVVGMITYAKERLMGIIAEISGIENEKCKQMMAMRFISGVVYPILMGDYLENIFGFSYNNPEDREKYLDLVISDILE